MAAPEAVDPVQGTLMPVGVHVSQISSGNSLKAEGRLALVLTDPDLNGRVGKDPRHHVHIHQDAHQDVYVDITYIRRLPCVS